MGAMAMSAARDIRDLTVLSFLMSTLSQMIVNILQILEFSCDLAQRRNTLRYFTKIDTGHLCIHHAEAINSTNEPPSINKDMSENICELIRCGRIQRQMG